MPLIAAAAGVVLDRALGEPPNTVHPVAWFGSAMNHVERHLYRDSTMVGVAHAATGIGAGTLAGFGLRAVSEPLSTPVATALAVAGRMLGEVALTIDAALQSDNLDEARRLLPSLVGRVADDLDEHEIARAVIESVAENTVDAVVAPALWGGVFGAPGALGYRAVNTLDAMVGHKSSRYLHYGWASARADDVANWIPARAAAAAVMVARPKLAGEVWRVVRRDAGAHPSPNSGVVEAAFAAALGLRLGGTNRYGERMEVRPVLGDGRPAARGDIAAAVRLSRDVTLVIATGLVAVALLDRRRRRNRGRR